MTEQIGSQGSQGGQGRLGRPGRQILRTLHLVSSAGWFGVGVAQLGLHVIANGTDRPALRFHAYEISGMFGQLLSAPLAITSLATGIVLAALTPWGVFRHRWIVAKLVLTCAVIGFASTGLASWSDRVTERAAEATAAGVGWESGTGLLWVSTAVLAVLLFLVVISVVKPWGRSRRDAGTSTGAGMPFSAGVSEAETAVPRP